MCFLFMDPSDIVVHITLKQTVSTAACVFVNPTQFDGFDFNHFSLNSLVWYLRTMHTRLSAEKEALKLDMYNAYCMYILYIHFQGIYGTICVI